MVQHRGVRVWGRTLRHIHQKISSCVTHYQNENGSSRASGCEEALTPDHFLMCTLVEGCSNYCALCEAWTGLESYILVSCYVGKYHHFLLETIAQGNNVRLDGLQTNFTKLPQHILLASTFFANTAWKASDCKQELMCTQTCKTTWHSSSSMDLIIFQMTKQFSIDRWVKARNENGRKKIRKCKCCFMFILKMKPSRLMTDLWFNTSKITAFIVTHCSSAPPPLLLYIIWISSCPPPFCRLQVFSCFLLRSAPLLHVLFALEIPQPALTIMFALVSLSGTLTSLSTRLWFPSSPFSCFATFLP